MLHLRVVCPSERASEVLRLLSREPGATHVVHLPGAAISPAGDVVEGDVAREALDDLLTRLGDLRIQHSGGITLEAVDTTISDAADRAERAAPGDPDDAVIWNELIARTGDESRLSVTFLAFLVIACLLAAIGAVTDSTVTVVGAMVLGPEFGPLAAVAVGLVHRRHDVARRGAVALAIGFPLAMAATAAAAAVSRGIGVFTSDPVAQMGEVSFIYQIGPTSVVVALLAGAAGMLSLTSAKSSALVGVFISVTTVPAAGFGAVAAVLGDWGRAGASLAQLAINLVSMVIAGVAVLAVSRRRQNLSPGA